MALSKEAASAVIAKYGVNEHDTGNTKVQVALLTERIQQLTEHERAFPKDKSAKRALLKIVGARRKLLKSFERTHLEEYRSLIKELGIRK